VRRRERGGPNCLVAVESLWGLWGEGNTRYVYMGDVDPKRTELHVELRGMKTTHT
jgi:hypothetical protein